MGKELGLFGNRFLLLFNIWMFFLVLSIVALQLPHWNILEPILTFANYQLFFLFFLLSLTLFLRSEFNRFTFLNLAIFAFLYFSGFAVIFSGNNYTFGSDHLQWYLWTYRKIAISLISSITILYIIVDYVYYQLKVIFKYAIVLLITVPIWFMYFSRFILNKKYLFENKENYRQIFTGISGLNAIIIFFILLYAYHCFNKENPISRYINYLVTFLLFFLAIDIVDNMFNYFSITLPVSHQLLLMANLIFINVILSANVYYVGHPFANFYESIIFSRRTSTMKLLRRRSITEKYVNVFQNYFKNKINRVMFLLLMIVSLSFFVYIYPYGYEKITFLIIVFLIISIGLYLNALFRRREKKKIL